MFDALLKDPASFQPLPHKSTPFYLYHGSSAALSKGDMLRPHTGYNTLIQKGDYVFAAHQWDYAMIFGLKPYIQQVFFSQEIEGRRHQILVMKYSISKELNGDPVTGLSQRPLTLAKLESTDFQPIMVYSFYIPQFEPAEWTSLKETPIVDCCAYCARDLVIKAGVQIFTYPSDSKYEYGISFERKRKVTFETLMDFVQRGRLLWENGRPIYDGIPNVRPISHTSFSHNGQVRKTAAPSRNLKTLKACLG